MSALDRALIRAYRTEHRPAASEIRAASLAGASGTNWSLHAAEKVAGPHFSVTESPVAVPTTTAANASLSGRPLSTYASGDLDGEPTRPQLVVDRFIWPEICDTLDTKCGPAFDGFIATLGTPIAKERKAIALVGASPRAGCSTTSLCLARRLARNGLRPVIVDADFARPELADLLSVAISAGWESVVMNSLPLEEALIESLEEQIVLAPLLPPVTGESLLQTSLRLSLMWRMLSEPYDAVLFDAGAVVDETSLARLKSLCEVASVSSVYAVCDPRRVGSPELAKFTEHLTKAAIPLAGIIENFSEAVIPSNRRVHPSHTEETAGGSIVHSITAARSAK